MHRILICSQDSLLVKAAYGLLRDAGYAVDTVEHTAEAVRSFFKTAYDLVILDSRDIGLDVTDAAAIIRHIDSDAGIFLLGTSAKQDDLFSFENPLDVAHIKRMIQDYFRRSSADQKGGIYDTKRNHA